MNSWLAFAKAADALVLYLLQTPPASIKDLNIIVNYDSRLSLFKKEGAERKCLIRHFKKCASESRNIYGYFYFLRRVI